MVERGRDSRVPAVLDFEADYQLQLSQEGVSVENSLAEGENTKACPYCAETIKAAAVLCRYCGQDLTATEPPEPPELPQPQAKKDGILVACANFVWGVVVLFGLGFGLQALNGSKPNGSPAAVKPALTATQLKQMAQIIPFDELARHTERYTGKIIQTSGTVAQVLEDGDGAQLRLFMDGESDQAIYVFYPGFGKARVLEDDHVTVIGPVYGRLTYEAVLGHKVTVPAVTAEVLMVQK